MTLNMAGLDDKVYWTILNSYKNSMFITNGRLNKHPDSGATWNKFIGQIEGQMPLFGVHLQQKFIQEQKQQLNILTSNSSNVEHQAIETTWLKHSKCKFLSDIPQHRLRHQAFLADTIYR